ncbi:hypothetical protein [Parasitella parasitica]|uniref:Uncharacterized protein n=1 Tax=Parasitella parasitica TaxID=35722 RepID=A0A0B7MTX6_9FUNG|nr:hypothetical protein [Parasitella parasitica]
MGNLVTKGKLFEWGCSQFVAHKAFQLEPADESERVQQERKFCNTCRTTLRMRKTLPTLCLEHGLRFPDPVPELMALTKLEERLVAPRHVFQSIWTLQGAHGQYRSKGGVVNVPVSVDTTVQSISRRLDDTNIIPVVLTRRMRYNGGYIKGNISTQKVWNAAHYLQSSPLYREHNISISTEWLEHVRQTQSEDEDVNDESDESMPNERAPQRAEGEDAPNENQIEEEDQQPGLDEDELNAGSTETSIASDEALRMAPGEGRAPISILVDRASDFLAFPKIFMGQRLRIPDTITYTSLCKSLARSFDRRAVSRVDYLLFMDRKIQLIRLVSNVQTILRKRTNANTGSPYTVRDLLDGNLTTLLNQDQAFRVLQGIRSSSEYWKTEKKNLMGMIRQFGIPTFFITLSTAETKWCELLVMLKKVVDGDVISETQAELLTSREKSRLLQSDPVTCARYFDYRFRELKKTWKTCEDGPFVGFDLIEYFFRIEFQHRGSPHVHMLIWLEDAPSIPANDSDENDTRVCDFINATITCEREWDGSPHTWNQENSTAESWADLLRRQTHRHTATCRRRRHGQVVCRFNIPFLPMNETMILRPISPDERIENHDQEAYRQKYKRIREYLNENSEALVASNTTFEEFLGTNGITNTACSYIVDYINKADKGLSRTLKELYERRARDPNSDVFDTLRSMATTYYNASEISVQEAAYNLLRIRMSEASTGCIHIPTARPENCQHILRDLETLGMINSESTDCFQPGLIEHYTNRPDEFKSLNLAQVAAYFEFCRKGPSSRSTRRDNEHEDQQNEQSDARIDNAGGPAGSFYPLRAGYPEMWIKRRKKSKVIRYYKFNKNDESRPDYFRTLLMLYKPWRNEETELMNFNAEEVVNINSGLIAFNFQEFTKIHEDTLCNDSHYMLFHAN